MDKTERVNAHLTPSMEEAAALHALGCGIIGGKLLGAAEVASFQRDGFYSVKAGSVGFECAVDRDDFAEVLQTVRGHRAKVSIALYQDGIRRCREIIKERRENV
jgi:NAD kinase